MKKWVVGSLMVAVLLMGATIGTLHTNQVAESIPPVYGIAFIR